MRSPGRSRSSLALVTTLPLAVVALVVLGGPAGVGSSLLYAHLRHSGGSTADVVNTRAIFSVAWVAGPPLAALIIGAFGNRAILAAIVAVAVLNVATTAAMMSAAPAPGRTQTRLPAPTVADGPPASKLTAGLVMVAFVGLQATNAVAVSIMTIYVTQTMHLDIVWAGIALGVAAGLEVPALLAMGKLSDRYSHLLLIATGCLAGIAYYLGLAFVCRSLVAAGAAAAQRLVLRCRRRGRPAAVPGPHSPSGTCHRPVHEHPQGRRDRLRADHRRSAR